MLIIEHEHQKIFTIIHISIHRMYIDIILLFTKQNDQWNDLKFDLTIDYYSPENTRPVLVSKINNAFLRLKKQHYNGLIFSSKSIKYHKLLLFKWSQIFCWMHAACWAHGRKITLREFCFFPHITAVQYYVRSIS